MSELGRERKSDGEGKEEGGKGGEREGGKGGMEGWREGGREGREGGRVLTKLSEEGKGREEGN